MKINPYLIFDGRCAEAFRFYERCLGGTIEAMMSHVGSPMENQVPAEWRDKIMHARLVVGDQVLMGSDAPPQEYQGTKGFWVTLGVADPAEAERLFAALAENGTVRMPIAQTFWALRFGMVVDRFGVPWMVNCEAPTS
jgi:PhnB protein